MKSKYLLLPLALLLASCGETNTSVTDTSTTDTSVDVNESLKEQLDKEIDLLLNASKPYTIRDSFIAIKDGEICLNTFSRLEYDSNNGIYYYLYQESGFSGLDSSSSYYSTSSTIYYQTYIGEDDKSHTISYTLDSDDMYIKKEEAKEIIDLEIGFDFSLVENLTFKQEGFRNTLTGVVKSNNANAFLSKSGKEISDIEFKSTSNGQELLSVELSYTQNGFNISRTVEYTYLAVTLELPKNIKKF